MKFRDILSEKEIDKKELIFTIQYSKYESFCNFEDKDIDELFKYIIDKKLESWKISLKSENGYEKSVENDIMKKFFETFFEELETSKENIKLLINLKNKINSYDSNKKSN